ncbi:RDD family protein [Solirubrobacter sp. CPCC 204708]|uniref:RDD family protein n=1 Tax=Solirubrobacter deserti TaxID=2282478 RepID=A0ABT4RR88_9ACTN|nr:RDD family protein [Solirubrobacter deserti]MBE2314866.1 RDD family protein [Solirubrobacter deserti]MDA0141093.1 RDD family protein [Solirubrobacter deserti]
MSSPRYGSWGARVGAAILDALMVIAVWLALLATVGIGAVLVGAALQGIATGLLLMLAGGVYYVGTMTRPGDRNGQTLGKQVSGLRVVRDDGKPIAIGTVLAREVLFKGFAWWFTAGIVWIVDVLWPLGERKRRALHDLVVRTHVLDVTPPKPQLTWARPMPRLVPPLARHVQAAYALRGRITQLDASLGPDIDVIVRALEASAGRAQMLWDALSETPPHVIEQRVEETARAGKAELLAALREQHTVARRMEKQLEHYRDEFERVIVELNTIRGHLVSATASTDADNRERLAVTVRELRDHTSALADGAFEAYTR